MLITNHLRHNIFVLMNALCLENWAHFSEYMMHENIYGICGVHPKYSYQYNLDVELNLRKALSNSRIVALGEIGFDLSRLL